MLESYGIRTGLPAHGSHLKLRQFFPHPSSQSFPDSIDNVKLRFLCGINVDVADVLRCWPVHFPGYLGLVVLQMPADIADMHVEAELMPVKTFFGLFTGVKCKVFYSDLHNINHSYVPCARLCFSHQFLNSVTSKVMILCLLLQ